MTPDEIVNALRENAEWCDANEYDVPLCMGDNQRAAADLIESLQAQLADRGTRPATNADHLRRMSDEELAKFQASRFNFTWKYMPESRWLDWLHQPAEEARDGQAR